MKKLLIIGARGWGREVYGMLPSCLGYGTEFQVKGFLDDKSDALDKFERLVNTLPMDRNQLRAAINNPCKDFEDMLQYQCALAGGCDVIITNNIKDFEEYSQLPLYTAAEYIRNL